jgi:hypothetical protein
MYFLFLILFERISRYKMGYGLDSQGNEFRFSSGVKRFPLLYSVHTGSGTHPASYLMGTRGCFSGDKAAGA